MQPGAGAETKTEKTAQAVKDADVIFSALPSSVAGKMEEDFGGIIFGG